MNWQLPRFKPGPLLLASLLACISYNSFALDPTSTLPIEIESDTATLDDNSGISTYEGNVIISQGETRLEADKILVKAVERRIVEISAQGSPAHFAQANSNPEGALTHGYAKQITYVAKEGILRLEQDAELTQQSNSFSGDVIEYDIVQKAIKAKGDEAQGHRVKIQYHPESTSTPASETDSKPAPTDP